MSRHDSDPAVRERVVPRFSGPLSVVGACVGVVAWLLPYLYGGSTVWLMALPVLGLLMLALPVVALRQLGLGLVASVLVWPVTVAAVVLGFGIGQTMG